MNHSRSAVSMRRQLIALSLLGTLLLMGFTRWALAGSSYFSGERYDLLLRIPMSNYPSWVANGWLPLDIVVGTAMLYGLMHVMNSPRLRGNEPSTIPGIIGMSLIMSFSFLGSMMGMIGAALGGWYVGLEAFVFGGAAGCALMIALAVLMGAVFGTGWLIREGYRRYLAPVFKPALAPLHRFFTAQDVPEHSESS